MNRDQRATGASTRVDGNVRLDFKERTGRQTTVFTTRNDPVSLVPDLRIARHNDTGREFASQACKRVGYHSVLEDDFYSNRPIKGGYTACLTQAVPDCMLREKLEGDQ